MDKNKDKLDLKNIGSRIRLQREMLNLSRENLSEISGLSSFYIGQIERGERGMSLDTLVKFSNIFNVSTDYLLFGFNACNQNMNKLENLYTIWELKDSKREDECHKDLQDLFILLSRFSKNGIRLVKDMVTLLLPYIE